MHRTDRDLMQDPPRKVVLMYQAVVDMVNEGVDVNNMKVADITARAGIGKGTAYEYFSTKEEIITRALLYEMMKCIDFTEAVAYNEEGFERKVDRLLDYGAEHFHKGRTIFQILKIMFGSYDISETLKEQFWMLKEENVCKQFKVLQQVIMEAGVKENILKENDLEKQRIVVNSQLVSFLMCVSSMQRGETNMSIEEVKHFIYENIVKLLGN